MSIGIRVISRDKAAVLVYTKFGNLTIAESYRAFF